MIVGLRAAGALFNYHWILLKFLMWICGLFPCEAHQEVMCQGRHALNVVVLNRRSPVSHAHE